MGHAIAPFVAPLGFDWKLGTSLITGFVAKEIVVSTMGVLYQAGEGGTHEPVGLTRELQKPENGITPLRAFAFMVFVLFFTPCIGTVTAIRREAGIRLMIFSVFYQMLLAWTAAFVVFQGGMLFGLG